MIVKFIKKSNDTQKKKSLRYIPDNFWAITDDIFSVKSMLFDSPIKQ